MTDRILYAAVAVALLGVLVLDPTFLENLFHALGGPPAITSLGIWEVSTASILAALIVAAIVMERRRP
jgi:hypothetical protein